MASCIFGVIQTPYNWLAKFYGFIRQLHVVGISSEHDLRLSIHMCCENSVAKLVLYKLLLHCNSHIDRHVEIIYIYIYIYTHTHTHTHTYTINHYHHAVLQWIVAWVLAELGKLLYESNILHITT